MYQNGIRLFHDVVVLTFNLNELPPELARAAGWLESHPDEAAMFSMRECARRAGLKPATFTRLAQYWGYDGFDALKARLP